MTAARVRTFFFMIVFLVVVAAKIHKKIEISAFVVKV
jgi:hypothetical protein